MAEVAVAVASHLASEKVSVDSQGRRIGIFAAREREVDFAQWFWRAGVWRRVGGVSAEESLISGLARKPWLVHQIIGVHILLLLQLAVLWWW